MKGMLRKRGSVLLTTITVLSIAAFVAIGLLQFVLATGKLDQRRNDGVMAFYIAEAGVNKVVHFFNHPDSYTPDQDLFEYDEHDDEYSNVVNALESGSIVISGDQRPVFTKTGDSGIERELGRVIELTLLPPDPNGPPCLAIIKSVGETYTGIQKTVHLYIFNVNQPFAEAPAALISLQGNNSFNGNVSVRWGEVWMNGDTQIQGSNKWGQYVDLTDPNWTRFLSTGQYKMTTGKYLNGTKNGSVLPLTLAAGAQYYNPNTPGTQLSAYNGRFLQHQDIDFPSYDYQAWKNLSLQKGEYFSTGNDGQIYRNGIEDAAHAVNFDTEFNQPNPDTAQYRFVFIDTKDGNPPAANGSNLATIQLSGGGTHTKGMFYMAANLRITGAGNPPDEIVKDPNNADYPLNKVFHDGLIYVSGDLDMQGNRVIYGSMIVERQITGNGTPEIWYNVRLGNNSLFPVNSKVQVRLFKVN